MEFRLSQIPIKISPCPITEAIIELRFESDKEVEELLNAVNVEFGNLYPSFEKLPILQIPDFIRDQDQNLRYSPAYKLSGTNSMIQIGKRTISLIVNNYAGWDSFFSEAQKLFTHIREKGFAQEIIRVGVRYVNFFDGLNIFDKINLQLVCDQSKLDGSLYFHNEFVLKNFTHIIKFSNKADFLSRTGSCLDIDLLYLNQNELSNNLNYIINEAHTLEKTMFFGLLKDDFLQSLNPQYQAIAHE